MALSSRARRALILIPALLIGIPVGLVMLAVVLVLVVANIPAGQHYIERQANGMTGGTVQISGLSGRFPDALHVGHLALKDTKGVWLTLDNLTLDWAPTRLIFMDARIDRLAFDRLSIQRLPVSDPNAKPSAPSSGQSSVPDFRIDLRALDAAHIDVGPEVAGVAASFSLNGHANIASIAPILKGVSVATLPNSDIALNLQRLDAPATLALTTVTAGKGSSGTLAMTLRAHEGQGGFLSTRVGMPTLDPVDLSLNMSGPRSKEALDFALSAGALHASTNGIVDLLHPGANIRVQANAPAMSLGTTASWQSVALDLMLHGPLSAPHGTGTLAIDGLSASGAGFAQLRATFDGVEAAADRPQDTRAHLAATLTGLRLPGSQPALLSHAPMKIDLSVLPFADGRPVELAVDHPLIQLSGKARTAGALSAALDLAAPDLGPLAAIGGVDLKGHTKLHLDLAMPQGPSGPASVALDGGIALTDGLKQAVALVGPDGRLSLRATMQPVPAQAGQPALRRIEISKFGFDGKLVHLADNGMVTLGGANPVIDDHVTLALPDLAAASPAVKGNTTLALDASGPTNDLSAKLHADANVGTAQVPVGPLRLDAQMQHLPSQIDGTVTIDGTLDRAPLDVAVGLTQDARNTRHISIDRLKWNSVSGTGTLSMEQGKKIPLGNLDIRVARLADFSRLAGQALSGALVASIQTKERSDTAPPIVTLDLHGSLAAPAARVGSLKLAGTVTDPTGTPNVDLTLRTDGIAVGKLAAGRMQVAAKGPQSALVVTASADMTELAGAPANLRTALTLNLTDRQVAIRTLTAMAKGENVRLLAPATVDFGTKMGVDHLRATLGPNNVAPASIDIAGTVKPALALSAKIDRLTPAIANPFLNGIDASGTMSVNAQLSGTIQRPQGKIAVVGSNLRMRTGNAAAIPAADVSVNATLAGSSAVLDAKVSAGPQAKLTASGTVPTDMKGPIAVRTDGSIDLSLANGILGASGRAAKGIVKIALAVNGTATKPQATGRIDLTGGDIQDYGQGVHLSDITAGIVASQDRITIEHFDARAGKGTMALAGYIGAFAPNIPVDLHFTSKNATPIASDLVTARIDTDLAIKGNATQRVDVTGTVRLPEVDVNIPNSMPASVASLNVIRPGQKPPTAGSGGNGPIIGLGIHVISPGYFFVRGHGLDAEMSGDLHVSGDTTAPVVQGGFDLRRGTFNLAGINLNFTRGRVGFNGSGVSHKLDPTLDFEADRNVSGTTAKLNVGGYASAPKISFSASPALPQDQVLALLLFGKSAQQLSTTELAEIAAALASLSGGSSFDPLGTVRKSLGLDRLELGGGSGVGNGGSSIEAGKYVTKGVYVGAKQATSGSGTQAQVQIDLTKRLKLDTTVGTGGNVTGFTTPENDPGSSVGLLYQFDY